MVGTHFRARPDAGSVTTLRTSCAGALWRSVSPDTRPILLRAWQCGTHGGGFAFFVYSVFFPSLAGLDFLGSWLRGTRKGKNSCIFHGITRLILTPSLTTLARCATRDAWAPSVLACDDALWVQASLFAGNCGTPAASADFQFCARPASSSKKL